MEPSLDNAYARARRARQHLTNLKRQLATLRRAEPNASVSVSPWTSGRFMDTQDVVPPIISILIGEAVYNLRAALDYLVYELAILDSGNVQQDTQFPIEDSPEGWRTRRDRFLKGLSRVHMAAILRLQPARHCRWTGVLRKLSNPDKHKRLSIVYLGADIPSNLSDTSQTVPPLPTNAMNVYGQATIQILFDDGRPVIETIQVLHANVTSVLNQFNPGSNQEPLAGSPD